MSFKFLTDLEYAAAFHEFGKMRKGIAELVHSSSKDRANLILDVPAGHGYLTAEFAHLLPTSRFIALGLRNDVDSYVTLRKSDTYPQRIWTHVEYIASDALMIPFSDGAFDLVINFLGLEDIHMTRGIVGVQIALSEMVRVLDEKGLLQISLVEYGDLPEEKIAQAVWAATGLNPIFGTREWYQGEIESLGLRLLEEKQFIYPKKMTAAQAREELKFACNVAPTIFSEFGVSARSFDDLWSEFEDRIEAHGMAYWSRIRVMLFEHQEN
ncbi:MAG: class I SAM-dependent methyltransferase [Candidatus Thorarchaeota archaeon]